MNIENDKNIQTSGLIYGILAFMFWGISPFYFKQITMVPSLEILAHRIIWSFLFLIIIVYSNGRRQLLKEAFRSRKERYRLLGTASLLSVNWFLFIWAITNGKILQASLGYFINPLVTIFLGVIFLKERLSKLALLSVILAFTGVFFQVIRGHEIPWVALILAFSFAFYGLIRKTAKTGSIVGLTVETIFLAPITIGYLVYLFATGNSNFGTVSWNITILLSMAGFVTTIPLIWFNKSARRIKLSSVGFIQYIAPSFQFLIAILYGEQFGFNQAVSFGLIWTALAIYTIDSLKNRQENHRKAVTE